MLTQTIHPPDLNTGTSIEQRLIELSCQAVNFEDRIRSTQRDKQFITPEMTQRTCKDIELAYARMLSGMLIKFLTKSTWAQTMGNFNQQHSNGDNYKRKLAALIETTTYIPRALKWILDKIHLDQDTRFDFIEWLYEMENIQFVARMYLKIR